MSCYLLKWPTLLVFIMNYQTVFRIINIETFIAGWLQGHWWGFISLNYVVWPTFLLTNVSLLLKDLISDFYLTSLQLVLRPCGGRKTSPRTSTIVQFIFYFGPLISAIIFWEIRNKWLVKTHILDRFLFIWTPFWFISVFESTAYLKFAKLQCFLWLSLPGDYRVTDEVLLAETT